MAAITQTQPVRRRMPQFVRNGNLWFYVIIIPFTLIWLIPVFSALLTAFRTSDDITYNGFLNWPKPFTTDAFTEAWTTGNLNKYVLNSFIITIPALLGALFLSSLSAYALARHRFRGNRLILMLYVGGLLLPFQIIMLPVFKLTNILGLYNSYGALIGIHTAFQLGFCTFVLRNFMRTVPGDLLDAAKMDGCSEFRIYSQIVMPLTLPALAALATLEFTWIFNDYIWAIVLLQDDSLKPVTAGLASLQGQYHTSYNVLVAGSLIATLPTVIVFIFLQRYFIKGLTLGSSK